MLSVAAMSMTILKSLQMFYNVPFYLLLSQKRKGRGHQALSNGILAIVWGRYKRSSSPHVARLPSYDRLIQLPIRPKHFSRCVSDL
jgi:hypothetical protein